MIDTNKLLDQLKKLSKSQFEELVFRLDIEEAHLRTDGVTLSQRAIDVIKYLQQEEYGLARLKTTLDELAFLKDVPTQIKAEVKSVSKLSIFNYPNKVCNILAKYDLHSASWRYDGDIQRYLCSTPYFNIGSVGSFGLANNIAFYAESKLAHTIQIVKLVLNINNELTKPVALQKFNRLNLALFEEISISIPDGLMPSIHEKTPNKFNQDYGTVELKIEKARRVESWSVTIQSLTDEEAERIETPIFFKKEAEYQKQQEATEKQQQPKSQNRRVPSFSNEEQQKYDDLSSEKNVDYTRLRDLLADGKWKEADEETLTVMLKATGREQEGYRYLDNKSIERFPCADLSTIDRLWVKYSDGRFGFSVQNRIWESVGGKPGEYDDEIYKKFGDRLGWRVEGKWLDFSDITFSQNAPEGHLPLSLEGKGIPRNKGGLHGFRVGGCFFVSFLASRLVKCNI